MAISMPPDQALLEHDILRSLLSDMMSTARWHQEAAPRSRSGGARQYEWGVWRCAVQKQQHLVQCETGLGSTASIRANGMLQVVKSTLNIQIQATLTASEIPKL